jgi:hypothetical protein
MSSTKQRNVSIASLIVIIAALVATILLVSYRQLVVDTIRAWQYSPSTSETSIRQSLALTQLGNFYYDASQPALEPAASFNAHCPHTEPNNPVVGCYNTQRIFIYDVQNDKLSGIKQTTAAHELLHAVYERLSDDERSRVDAELQAVYDMVKNEELEQRMAYYQKNEPGQENNELHSILGTEYDQLGTALEAHYGQYFTDRNKIIKFYQSYKQEFTDSIKQLNDLADEINRRTKTVNQDIANYNSQQQALEADADRFDRRASSGDFSTRSEFDATRAQLVNRQNQLRSERNQLRKEIKAINKLRSEYAALQKEYQALASSINSNLQPAPAL